MRQREEPQPSTSTATAPQTPTATQNVDEASNQQEVNPPPVQRRTLTFTRPDERRFSRRPRVDLSALTEILQPFLPEAAASSLGKSQQSGDSVMPTGGRVARGATPKHVTFNVDKQGRT